MMQARWLQSSIRGPVLPRPPALSPHPRLVGFLMDTDPSLLHSRGALLRKSSEVIGAACTSRSCDHLCAGLSSTSSARSSPLRLGTSEAFLSMICRMRLGPCRPNLALYCRSRVVSDRVAASYTCWNDPSSGKKPRFLVTSRASAAYSSSRANRSSMATSPLTERLGAGGTCRRARQDVTHAQPELPSVVAEELAGHQLLEFTAVVQKESMEGKVPTVLIFSILDAEPVQQLRDAVRLSPCPEGPPALQETEDEEASSARPAREGADTNVLPSREILLDPPPSFGSGHANVPTGPTQHEIHRRAMDAVLQPYQAGVHKVIEAGRAQIPHVFRLRGRQEEHQIILGDPEHESPAVRRGRPRRFPVGVLLEAGMEHRRRAPVGDAHRQVRRPAAERRDHLMIRKRFLGIERGLVDHPDPLAEHGSNDVEMPIRPALGKKKEETR
eukprot:scaffold8015_cov277-Pinguiococcus_pyrenoidosus.AAC.2